MTRRRHFFGNAALGGVALARLTNAGEAPAPPSRESRADWVAMLSRVAGPVINALASNELKKHMPVEISPGSKNARDRFTHLEALGRTLAGIAPWLGTAGLSESEEGERSKFAALARQGLTHATDPGAADGMDFTAGPQNLVDAAFLALGLLRAPHVLWQPLSPVVRKRLLTALVSTRKFKPGRNNWLLFSATIEAFLASVGASWQPEPIETALRSHEEWYQGDGIYGDGPEFHWDYYNSFVIQPMLLAVMDAAKAADARWEILRDPVMNRARRYAAVQERLIAPDGSFPAVGRSITYRCGAFHLLADIARRGLLPDGIQPAQVRCALSAVISRTLGAADTFDAHGWLRIGLAGHQPSLAEGYISTGSLYLCTCVFLPLGLPLADTFWRDGSADWTSRRIWKGANLPADHAI